MRRLYILLLIATLGSVGRITAQNTHGQLKALANRFYELGNQQVSADGKWGSFTKRYEDGADTLVVYRGMENEGKETPLPGCKSVFFLPENRALLKYNDSVVLRDLGSGPPITFKGGGSISEGISGEGFMIHYDNIRHKNLVFYDSRGNEKSRIVNCRGFVKRADAIFSVCSERTQYMIYKTTQRGRELLYESNEEIEHIEAPLNTAGLLIWQREQSGLQVYFYDYKRGKKYVLYTPAERFDEFYSVHNPSEDVFVFSAQKLPVTQTNVPDIWYGDDLYLERKFGAYPVERTLVWEPRVNKISYPDTERYKQSFSIGNARYFLVYDAEEGKDYTQYHQPLSLAVYDRLTGDTEDLGMIGKELLAGQKGEQLVYKKGNCWIIYDLTKKHQVELPAQGMQTAYFSKDGKAIIFTGFGGIWKYTVHTEKLVTMLATPQMTAQILNAEKKYLLTDYFYFHRTIDDQYPVLVSLANEENNTTALGLIEKGKFRYLTSETSDRIDEIVTNEKGSAVSFRRQNFNLPPEIILMHDDKTITVGKSNSQNSNLASLRQQVITYTNQDHVLLKGVLYFPTDFDPHKRYPMITEVYEEQNTYRNKFLRPSFCSPKGSNIRLFIEQGYFVFHPDIVYDESGPGLSALACINSALDAVLENTSIDRGRVALMGHSFGAYETNFVATHSDRFKTYISGNGHSDIVHTYFNYAENYNTPNYMVFENGQYRMNVSFAEHKDLYFKNNPIYHTERISAPILLWAGMQDNNVDWRETRSFYNALKRNGKKVVCLFYPKDGHTLSSPESQNDLTLRILEWFAGYLKDDRTATWINLKE